MVKTGLAQLKLLALQLAKVPSLTSFNSSSFEHSKPDLLSEHDYNPCDSDGTRYAGVTLPLN